MGKSSGTYYKGFTLIELVVVIVVTGILSALGGLMITNYMEGYVDTTNRAKLVDSAESALRRMERDIRAALPNSIETRESAHYKLISLLHTAAGGRYRTECPSGSTKCSGNQTLEFGEKDDKFSMIGRLRKADSNMSAVFQNAKIVVYNTGQSPADAYDSPKNNAADIQGVDYKGSAGVAPSSNFTITRTNFPYRSPNKRFHIVDSQVRYVWNKNKNTLHRYSQDAGSFTDPETLDPAQWGSGSLAASDVEKISFKHEQATYARAALVSMNATLFKQGESITLLHQVHINNYP